MTRVFPILTAAATAAFLTFGGAAAFAAAVNGQGHPGGPPGGPSAPSGPTGGKASAPLVYGCDYQANETGLDGAPRRAFLGRCLQGGAF